MELIQSNLEGTEKWNPKKIKYKTRQTKQSTLDMEQNPDLESLKDRLLRQSRGHIEKSAVKFSNRLCTFPVSQDIAKKLLNFKEKEYAVAQRLSRGTRKHVGVPCDIAQDIEDLELRLKHINGCEECKKLYTELEDRIQPR